MNKKIVLKSNDKFTEHHMAADKGTDCGDSFMMCLIAMILIGQESLHMTPDEIKKAVDYYFLDDES